MSVLTAEQEADLIRYVGVADSLSEFSSPLQIAFRWLYSMASPEELDERYQEVERRFWARMTREERQKELEERKEQILQDHRGRVMARLETLWGKFEDLEGYMSSSGCDPEQIRTIRRAVTIEAGSMSSAKAREQYTAWRIDEIMNLEKIDE